MSMISKDIAILAANFNLSRYSQGNPKFRGYFTLPWDHEILQYLLKVQRIPAY